MVPGCLSINGFGSVRWMLEDAHSTFSTPRDIIFLLGPIDCRTLFERDCHTEFSQRKALPEREHDNASKKVDGCDD